MAIPKSKAEPSQDESQSVSSTSDETLAERYTNVKEQDKSLSTAERLKKLREGAKYFQEMASSEPKKADEV